MTQRHADFNGYVNTHQGCLKLFICGRLIRKESFRTPAERKYILYRWLKIFKTVQTKDLVSIHLFYYSYNYRNNDNVTIRSAIKHRKGVEEFNGIANNEEIKMEVI